VNIILNDTRIDWFTISTFDKKTGNEWSLYLMAMNEGELRIQQRLQYTGIVASDKEGGNIFFGDGFQDGKQHFIVQCSGNMAHLLYPDFSGYVSSGLAKCTRVDLQRTVVQPPGWSQLDYETECEAKGYKPTKRRSRAEYGEGELMTVYSGKRTSGRLNRLYQKQQDDGTYLIRYETEYSRAYSHKVAHGIALGEMPASFLNSEIERRNMPEYLDQFRDDRHGVSNPKLTSVRLAGKTEKWLLEVCLPSLVRYMASHDANPAVMMTYYNAIDRQMRADSDV
jgi:hypothetical protein